MVDDKDKDAHDPWAGIDAEDASEPQGGFSFSLDEEAGGSEPSTDEGFPGVFAAPVGDAAGDAAPENVAGVFEDFVEESLPEITAGAGEGLPFADVDVPAFDAELPSLDDGGSDVGDLAGFGDDDAAPVNEWLTEEPAAEMGVETPLAVFPSDDLHDLDHSHEHRQDREADESAILSSAIQIGTGNSGVMSSSDVIPIDEWADAGATSLVGMPDVGGEPSAADAADEPAVDAFGFGAVEADEDQTGESPAFGIAEDNANDFGDADFGMDEAAAAVGGGLAVAGAEALGEAVAAAPAGKKKTKAAKPAKSSGGGIGQMIGIVLGGLMALPITYAILVWGFQKDPFKFTKMVPPGMAFLLPEKFQPGFRKSVAGGPKLDQAASLDSLPNGDPGAEPPMATEAEASNEAEAVTEAEAVNEAEAITEAAGPAPADEAVAESTPPAEPVEQPAAPAEDLFTEEPEKEPVTAVVPEPKPLDYSGLEAAIAKANASFDALSGIADPEDPSRKKLLVGWYKNLAAVAEQMVFLETAAADSARPLEKAPEQVEAVIGKLMGNDALVGDLGRLSGMWLSSKKRPVDGAVLVATFNDKRQVGPYWSSSITVAGKEPKTVAIISRREPSASAGEQVIVTGVLFDGDALWAADCRRLEKAAAAEDLF